MPRTVLSFKRLKIVEAEALRTATGNNRRRLPKRGAQASGRASVRPRGLVRVLGALPSTLEQRIGGFRKPATGEAR